jgi:hypothetical protein
MHRAERIRQIGVALLLTATVVLFVVGLGAITQAMSVTATRVLLALDALIVMAGVLLLRRGPQP